MSQWMFALQTAIALSINLSFGIYILALNPRSRINRMYFIYTLTLSIWLLGATVQRLSSSPADIILWQKVQYLGATLVPPMYLLFLRDFLSGEENMVKGISVHLVTFGMACVIIATLPTGLLITGDIKHDAPWEYGAFGPLISVFVLFFFSCTLFAMVTLFLAYKETRSRNRKMALRIVWVSTLFGGLIGSLTDAILPSFGIFYPIADVTTIPFVASIAYTIYKYKLFIPAARSGPSPRKAPVRSEIGFMIGNSRKAVMRTVKAILEDRIKHRPVLMVTEKDPEEVREELGTEDIDILWVTDKPVHGIHFDTTQLQEVRDGIQFFLERNPHGVVVFTANERMIRNNSSDLDQRRHLLEFMSELVAHGRNFPVLMIFLGRPGAGSGRDEGAVESVPQPILATGSLIPFIFEVVVNKIVMTLKMTTRDLVQSDSFMKEHLRTGTVHADLEAMTLVPEGEWDADRLIEALRTYMDSVDQNKKRMSMAILRRELHRLGIDHHEVSINKGVITLFRSDDQKEAFAALKGLSMRHLGMCITRSAPERARRAHNLLEDVQVVWWTQKENAGNGTVSSLEHMEAETNKMFEMDNGATVLIDGLDILVQAFGLESVFRFIQRLHDEVATRGGRIIFTIGTEGLPEKELRLLSKNMEQME